MRTLYALLAAAALVVLCMGGCTIILNSQIRHEHVGDTIVDANAEVGLGGAAGALPIPSTKLVIPSP